MTSNRDVEVEGVGGARFIVLSPLCECGHGKSWHIPARNGCAFRKRRNTGMPTGHKRCDCVKFNEVPGTEKKVPLLRKEQEKEQ